MAELHKQILSWGERWHLTDPWLLDVALQYLRLRHQGHPWDAEDPFVKGRFPDPSFIDTDKQVGLVRPEWHPQWESRAAYKENRLREIDEHMDEKEAWAESQGMKPGIKKRGSFDKHFEWLARYQVVPESYGEVGQVVHADRSTVRDAVRKTADLIGLTLRAGSPSGRKPSS